MSFQVVVTTMEGADRLPCSLVSTVRMDLSKKHLPVTNLNGLVTSLSSSSAILMIANERSDMLEDAYSYVLPVASTYNRRGASKAGRLEANRLGALGKPLL